MKNSPLSFLLTKPQCWWMNFSLRRGKNRANNRQNAFHGKPAVDENSFIAMETFRIGFLVLRPQWGWTWGCCSTRLVSRRSKQVESRDLKCLSFLSFDSLDSSSFFSDLPSSSSSSLGPYHVLLRKCSSSRGETTSERGCFQSWGWMGGLVCIIHGLLHRDIHDLHTHNGEIIHTMHNECELIVSSAGLGASVTHRAQMHKHMRHMFIAEHKHCHQHVSNPVFHGSARHHHTTPVIASRFSFLWAAAVHCCFHNTTKADVSPVIKVRLQLGVWR